MTDIITDGVDVLPRAALVVCVWDKENQCFVPETSHRGVTIADALSARIAELESELLEQCRVAGAGSEREARLLGRIGGLERELAAAKPDIVEACAMAVLLKAAGHADYQRPQITAEDYAAEIRKLKG